MYCPGYGYTYLIKKANGISNMKETKFKLTLSAPVDKNGVAVKLTLINIENLNTLRISHYPEFAWYTIGIAFFIGISLLAILINLSNLAWIIIVLGIIVYSLYYERAFSCSINKTTGKIIYSRSGVLMSRFDQQKVEYGVSQITRLEMQRYIRGGGLADADKFQIFLLINNQQRLPLSSSNLDFGECQDFTEQIRSFLGNEIPIKALD